MPGLLANALGIGITSPKFLVNTYTCHEEVQRALWSRYVQHRQEGQCQYQRKSKHNIVRIFQFQCYIVKEYTGDPSKLATELAVLQHLHHESLVGYLFIANEGARVSIFMDWAGQGLRELVEGQQRQPLGEDAARFIAGQLTNSLAYLHNKGIIHRDIKPDNIGVQPDLTVKLFDWGEALLVNELHSLTDRQLIKAARVAGTPLFMPPEVLLYLTRKGADSSSSSSSSSASSSRGSSSSNGSDETAGSSANASSSRGLQERQHTRTAAAGCSCWGGLGSAKLLQQAAALHELASTKVDIWGLGTVVYFLLAGRDILQDDSGYDLEDIADIVSASGGIQLPKTAQASPAARDFLARALERDPAKRACVAELLQHPWLAGLASAAHLKPLLSLSARSSEAQGTAYVIAAHRGLLQGAAASVPGTPVSGSTELLSDISEYE